MFPASSPRATRLPSSRGRVTLWFSSIGRTARSGVARQPAGHVLWFRWEREEAGPRQRNRKPSILSSSQGGSMATDPGAVIKDGPLGRPLASQGRRGAGSCGAAGPPSSSPRGGVVPGFWEAAPLLASPTPDNHLVFSFQVLPTPVPSAPCPTATHRPELIQCPQKIA